MCEQCEEGGEGGPSALYWRATCVLSWISLRLTCMSDCSPSGSSVHEILQAEILEWVSMPSSRGSSWPRDLTRISHISSIDRQILYHFTASATREAPLRLKCAHKYRKYTSEEEIHHWWQGFHHCFLAFCPSPVWSPWGAGMQWTSFPEAVMSEIRGAYFSWTFLSLLYSVLICFLKTNKQTKTTMYPLFETSFIKCTGLLRASLSPGTQRNWNVPGLQPPSFS